MNYGDIKSHFDALLNRSDITAALTTLFIDQGIRRIQRRFTDATQRKQDDLHLRSANRHNHAAHGLLGNHQPVL